MNKVTNRKDPEDTTLEVLYDVEEKPPFKEAVPLGLQHVLVMFSGNVSIPLILAVSIGAPPETRIFLVQAALLVAGLATLVQALGIGPVGARLPVVMGTSIGFVLVAIPIAQEYGLPAVFGGAVVAGVIQFIFGASIKRIRFLFPPLVAGIVVTIIGITVLPIGMNLAAGGAGSPDFGHPANLALAGFVTLVIVVVNQFTRGFTGLIAILIGIAAGYLVAIPLGMVDFDIIRDAEWFALPVPFQKGISFPLAAILGMGVMSIAVAIETIGDLAAITKSGADREITAKELSGGLMGDGVGTALASVFGALPNTSYSQNVGVVAFTGVMSRHVVAVGALFLIAFALIPKLGGVVSAMPAPVLGGAALIMFALVAVTGIKMLVEVRLNRRNMLIIAISLGVGLGMALVPESVRYFPRPVQAMLETGIIQAAFLAIVLNLVLPDPEAKR